MAKKSLQKIYQIKVTLDESKPPIWRRLLVPNSITLSDLHKVIQFVMGWHDEHMHQFIANGEFYGNFEDVIDESEITLNKLLKKEKDKIAYEYDFGDSWGHIVLLEKILLFDSKITLPSCIKGKRACPPENVGGVWGYEEFLQIIKDPNHPEHDEYLEWIGEDVDPEKFDLDGVNKDLARYITL